MLSENQESTEVVDADVSSPTVDHDSVLSDAIKRFKQVRTRERNIEATEEESEETKKTSQAPRKKSQPESVEEPTENPPEKLAHDAGQIENSENHSQEEEKVPPKLAKSWAQISKKEASLRNREREVEERLASLERGSQELSELRSMRDSLKSDPVSFMQKHGGDGWYETATKRYLENPQTGEAPADERIARLELQLQKEREDRDKWLEDKLNSYRQKDYEQNQVYQQEQRYLTNAQELIDSDDRFELCRARTNIKSEIKELVEGYYAQHKTLLSTEEAATLIEQELENEAKSYASTRKMKTLLGLKLDQPSSKDHDATSRSPKTLSNQLSAVGGGREPQTDDERISAAARMVELFKKNKR